MTTLCSHYHFPPFYTRWFLSLTCIFCAALYKLR